MEPNSNPIYREVINVLKELSLKTAAPKKRFSLKKWLASPLIAGFWLSSLPISVSFILASHKLYAGALFALSIGGLAILTGFVVGAVLLLRNLLPNPVDILVLRGEAEERQITALLKYSIPALKLALSRVKTQSECFESRTSATRHFPEALVSAGLVIGAFGATGIFKLLPVADLWATAFVNAGAVVLVFFAFCVKASEILSGMELATLREKEFYLAAAVEINIGPEANA